MAPERDPDFNEDDEIEFKMVETTFEVSGGSRRGVAAVEINPFGRSVTNVAGAEKFMAYFIKHGIDPMEAHFTYGANSERGLIGLYAARGNEPGAMPCVWNRHRKTYSFHIGAVISQHPDLRPITRIETTFRIVKDKKKRECISIKIKGASAKRKGAADTEEMAARAEAEAAKKAARSAARKRITDAKQGESPGKAGEEKVE